MDTALNNDFDSLLTDLSQGFTVNQIATYGLETCSPEERISAVEGRFPDFDQIPVKENGYITGMFYRSANSPDQFIKEVSHPLDESFLISAHEPLSELLPLLANAPYFRLVLKGSKISGIVTRSDVLKLPVRAYAFILITNLELIMKEIILKNFQHETDWFSLLDKNAQDKIIYYKDKLKKQNIDPRLIEFTDFSHKYVVLRKHLNQPDEFSIELENINELIRNPIAHAKEFVQDTDSLRAFIHSLELTKKWTKNLSENYLFQSPTK